MSRQLREHIRKQLKTILESKNGYYKGRDGRIKQGDFLASSDGGTQPHLKKPKSQIVVTV